MTPEEILAQIAADASKCTRCNLHFSRKKSVPGEGPVNATLMLIGEGPGFHENEQGRPFVGAAGKLLEELLEKIGMNRGQVFISNVVKCRPPSNRDPLPDELSACSSYLDQQITVINPRLIVTLGRFSMARFLPNAKISEVHGQSFHIKGRVVVPMYHPAAALHQPSLKPYLFEDFARLPEIMAQSTPAQTEEQPVEKLDENRQAPKQLSLF